jgi:hypothetical protein
VRADALILPHPLIATVLGPLVAPVDLVAAACKQSRCRSLSRGFRARPVDQLRNATSTNC